MLALSVGIYSVPMYALIQLRSRPSHQARIIAANNILNALFMIGSSLIAGALLGAGFTVPQIFLFTGLANAVVAFYIFMLVPEYLLRFVAWVASRCVYRFKVQGDEHIPVQGAAILAFQGHVLMENRSGLVVGAMVTHADGLGERAAARTPDALAGLVGHVQLAAVGVDRDLHRRTSSWTWMGRADTARRISAP